MTHPPHNLVVWSFKAPLDDDFLKNCDRYGQVSSHILSAKKNKNTTLNKTIIIETQNEQHASLVMDFGTMVVV